MEFEARNIEGFRAVSQPLEIPVKNYSINLLDGTQVFAKRVLDFILSLTFLTLVGSWLFLIIALFIKLESRGPVFFKQRRGGQYNDPFVCYKFRTMTFNPNATFKQAEKNDSRVTRIGAFLRKSSLDELPQLFNVLLGNMSIVGPRPHAVEMDADCMTKYENYKLRLLVKPGITGLAQAKGFRGEIKKAYQMRARIKLDLFYIKTWNFWFDIRIIYLTVLGIVFKNENAY